MSKYIFALPILMLVICGCTSETQYALPTVSADYNEKIFLDNAPCPAPCWQNLTLGVSNKNEVLEEVSRFNFLDANGIAVNTQQVQDINSDQMVNNETIFVTCINRLEPCIVLTVVNDKLAEVYIKLDKGLLVNQIIEKYGIPDYVGSHYKGGEVTDCRIEVIWFTHQIVLYSIFFDELDNLYDDCVLVDKTGLIPANAEILDVRFLPLALIKESVDRRALSEYRGLK